jgi:hypothetical protein
MRSTKWCKNGGQSDRLCRLAEDAGSGAGWARAALVVLAVTTTGTLAMHILVLVLPLAAADFGVSRGTIQLAVTLYLFGIAGGQLLYAQSPTGSGGGGLCSPFSVFMSQRG